MMKVLLSEQMMTKGVEITSADATPEIIFMIFSAHRSKQ
jgi:hypothetical protein